MKRKEFFSQWLPFLKLMQYRYADLYIRSEMDGNESMSVDDMSLDEVRAFFTARGLPVRSK